MTRVLCGLILLALAAPVAAQTIPPVAKTISLSGPRFGMTILSDGVMKKLEERQVDLLRPVVTQFGWQFERQFFRKDSGLSAVQEWVFLVGGLEQSTPVPSLSWMVGLRTQEGMEFGIGPNITPGGVALAVAAGVTVRAGVLNVPLNVAYVPSRAGSRISVLTGFSFRGPR